MQPKQAGAVLTVGMEQETLWISTYFLNIYIHIYIYVSKYIYIDIIYKKHFQDIYVFKDIYIYI